MSNYEDPCAVTPVTTNVDKCNALSNYLIILLDDMVYVYILYDFDDYVTYL